jgi:hypothetical protein
MGGGTIGGGDCCGCGGCRFGLMMPDISKIVRKLQTTNTRITEPIPQKTNLPPAIFAFRFRPLFNRTS